MSLQNYICTLKVDFR